MRKVNRITAAITALFVLGALWVYPAQGAESDRHITVSGVGTVSVVPDAVRFYLSVTSLSDKSASALSSASKAASNVRAALKSEAIATKDIKSSNLSVYPEYNYTQDKGQSLIGYRAAQSFVVTIRNAKSAGAIVDAVVGAGGDSLQVNGVSPFILDTTKATLSARSDAVKKAKAKATSYASLLGVKLGKVIYVGQTSATVERRLAQHQGQILSKSGKFIGSSKVRNRNEIYGILIAIELFLFSRFK